MNSQYLRKKKLPDSPGVYFFKKEREILYIGRATSLRDRVRSYFSSSTLLRASRGQLIVDMVDKSKTIGFEKTDSVLEAIILEANLIKKYQPKYNTDEKDDKSFNYVVITEDDFPQIFTVRGRNIGLKADSLKLKAIFGPFPNSGALYEALKFIRRIFPYRDKKCGALSRKLCFNRHIGLCPGTCTGEITKVDYAKTVKYIIQIFEGKKQSVTKSLEKEMLHYAKTEKFEKASEVKRKLFALKHIRDVYFIKKEYDINTRMDANDTNGGKIKIESYDVAHMGGKNTIGAMVVMEDGEFIKKDYRTFNIRQAKAGDDIGALSELLDRRFKHSEWRFPDIVVIDGGQVQLNTAIKIIKNYRDEIKVISVVKNIRHKAMGILGDGNDIKEKAEIFRINAETHRFVIGRLRKAIRRIPFHVTDWGGVDKFSN